MINKYFPLSIPIGIVLAMSIIACDQRGYSEEDYDYAALETETLLMDWQESVAQGGLSTEEMDRLNLHVRAIFAHRCFQCHSTAKHKGALILDQKEGVFEGGDGGAVIIPGNAKDSRLLQRVLLPRGHEETMPPEGSGLSEAETRTLQLWIDQGAHWTDADLKIFREAPLTLDMPKLPEPNTDRKHPVDQWVDQYFSKEGVTWPATIDDRRFIRRVYLDIVGLLPSAAEVESFVSDGNTDKRTILIDQLLADDKNYTEHWLSFWNDLLRNDYSGTGFITKGREQISAWLYRALHENISYDDFVGQLINPTEASEGFINGIRWRGVVNASQRTELQAAQNISQSLLGINLKCASCHNSFINNVTLQQAYNFAQIFVDSTIELYRCDKPTGKYAQPTFLYPELGEILGDSVVDRLESLVGVMVQPKNGRLYRTVVNRYWDKLLGRGLIAPVDEMDNPPWSQELLDWLAAYFRDNGGDLKALIRQITTSRIYQSEVAIYKDPYHLRSSKFVFRGPVTRRMTAEQLADAISQLFVPMYRAVAFDPDTNELAADWIWHRQIEFDRTVLPYPGKRYFRKKFSARPQDLDRAEIMVTADHQFRLFINEKEIGEAPDWQRIHRFYLKDILTQENIIAVEATNDGEIPNPAGVLFALKMQYADGTTDTISSDDTWVTTDGVAADLWKSLTYIDTGWVGAWRAGSSVRGHWGKLRDFNFDHRDTSMARASLVKLDPFLKGLGRPVRENVTTQRDEHVTLLQSLLLSNDQFFAEAIAKSAKMWIDEYGSNKDETIQALWVNTLGRQPSQREWKFIEETFSESVSQTELEDLIWSVLLLPEFQFI